HATPTLSPSTPLFRSQRIELRRFAVDDRRVPKRHVERLNRLDVVLGLGAQVEDAAHPRFLNGGPLVAPWLWRNSEMVGQPVKGRDRKSTRLNSSHSQI